MQFSELDLIPQLQEGIRDVGFTECTEVQSRTLEHSLAGRDVAVQSQTGTGKTAAFLITIFQLLMNDPNRKGSKALVVAPTRELAVQIESDAKAIGGHLPLIIGSFYGGVGYVKQEQLVADGVDLIIGTPGRLLDFNKSRKLDFHDLGIIVIDEADRLFDMGFYPDIRMIMRQSRPRTERMTMLFSATLSVRARNIAWQFMNDPAEVAIDPEQMTVDEVEQELYHVSKEEKFRLLLGLLRKENPKNALIFCNTKRATEMIAQKLTLNGYACEFIIGDLPQKKRLKIIDSLKDGTLSMLCATDVAARGLHVNDLELVVNYDLPEDPEAYVHRIGRTARAGKQGKAVSLACERFVYSLEPIQELIGMKIPSSRVSDDLLVEDASRGRPLPSSHHLERRPTRRGDRTGRSHPRSGRSPATARHGGEQIAPRRSPSRDGAHDGRAAKPRAHTDRPDRRTPRPPHRNSRPAEAARTHDGPDSGAPAPSRESSMDERLAYYRKKYGENFSPAKGAGQGQEAKPKREPGPADRPRESDRGSGSDRQAETRRRRGLIKRIFGRKGESE